MTGVFVLDKPAGMTSFGASGPAGKLFEMFGFTADNVVEKAFRTLNKANG